MNRLVLFSANLVPNGRSIMARALKWSAPAGSNQVRACSSNPIKDGSNDLPDFEMENPYKKEKRQCILCKYGIELNYKNPRLLSQFVSSFTGRVYDKHITGLCDRQQKALIKQIKLAQFCCYMPREHKTVQYMKDPPLFDPFRPSRPHPY